MFKRRPSNLTAGLQDFGSEVIFHLRWPVNDPSRKNAGNLTGHDCKKSPNVIDSRNAFNQMDPLNPLNNSILACATSLDLSKVFDPLNHSPSSIHSVDPICSNTAHTRSRSKESDQPRQLYLPLLVTESSDLGNSSVRRHGIGSPALSRHGITDSPHAVPKRSGAVSRISPPRSAPPRAWSAFRLALTQRARIQSATSSSLRGDTPFPNLAARHSSVIYERAV